MFVLLFCGADVLVCLFFLSYAYVLFTVVIVVRVNLCIRILLLGIVNVSSTTEIDYVLLKVALTQYS